MIYCIGTVIDKNGIVGYNFLDTTVMETECIDCDIIKQVMEKVGKDVVNCAYDFEFNTLVAKGDISIVSMPKLTTDGLVQGQGGIAVGNLIRDPDTGKMIGAVVCNSYGSSQNVSWDKLNRLVRKNKPVNFKMQATSDGVQAVPINGETWDIIDFQKEKRKSSNYMSGLGEEEVKDVEKVVRVPAYALDKIADDEFNIDSQKIMYKAMNNLKLISPYYWVLMQAVNSYPNNNIPTMGVTENKMYYNTSFVAGLTVPKLTFILVHELKHLVMQHSLRKGKRDAELWNIACDIYINEDTCREFGLAIGVETDVPLKRNKDGSPAEEHGRTALMEAPTDGCYATKIEMPVDLSKDIPEVIYQKLQRNSEGQPSYNGKTIHSDGDVMANTDRVTPDEQKRAAEESIQQVQSMETKRQIMSEKIGEDLTQSMSSSELVKRYIEYGLSSRLDWRLVLKNMAKYVAKKMYTLAFPNQDYMNRGITIASRQKVGKQKTQLRGIKICVDVSGSISDAKLKSYLSEVANIFTHFKVTGELIYWSTNVGDCGDFARAVDLQGVQPNSTGGTDVKCVFDFLAGKTKTQTGKKEREKVKDIIGVVILTDGCFSQNYGEYEAMFGQKTLWILDNFNINFNPSFGRVALLDLDKE